MPPSSIPPITRQQQPVLDTRYQVETPEGIDLALRPAGLVPRALAFTIDLLIRGAILAVVYLTLGMFGQLGMGIATIALFLVTWWYMVLFEVLNQGRSPGKQLLGLRVVHDDGTPIGWPASLTRNLLRFVDLLPFAYTLGIISCLSNRAFKRLGDIAAGTLVVYRDQSIERPSIPEADALRAPFPLDFAEQRAMLAFAERSEGLSTARRAELAAILAEPLQVDAEHAEGRINGIARSLLGPT
ncbi:RDD family protein [Pseudomonas sp. MM211]|uniref:RDD family protein n=1 Tax=Pseudomonas sp. MM211 TaxID=2866808 RepID=UPI001CEC0884|nr:RDD family protein [Pseudomonas sp. MM211]UCJ18657.1 RDD family protein [Pseudomonas sp. MM211]